MSFFGFIKLLFTPDRKFIFHLKNILGFIPYNTKFYELALTHRSASIRINGTLINNERLEFLGDAVLDSIVAEYLFHKYPHKNEGFLSKMRSKIVKRKNLNEIGVAMELEKVVRASNINCTGGKHLYGNALEALIGAIYLDKGYHQTSRFIINRIIKSHINLEQLEYLETDFKSRIIEWAQKNHSEISFENQEEYHSDEKIPQFISRIKINNSIMGQGKGFSKKEAEQNAAEQAFVSLVN